MTVAAVVLAAGGSTRFGHPKQLLPWQGRPLVAHVADVAWLAGLSPVVVVLGAEAARIAPALEGRPVLTVRNYRWETGVSSSIAVGLAPLPPQTEAAIFLQADQPLIIPPLLQAMVERWRESGAEIVVPTTAEGRRGTPVLFARPLFGELAHLTGDVGGRALFAAHADRLTTFPVAEPHILADADTPDAYAALQALARERDPLRRLATVRAVLADMDGVLWRGGRTLPGFADFFAFLDERGLDYVLITNNSSRTPEQYMARLAKFGVRVARRHILTASMATADYLAERTTPEATLVYAIGGPGVMEALRGHGFRFSDGSRADYVVMGWDRHLSWDKLATATRLIRSGATFIATNPDPTFPVEEGVVPGNGAQAAALRTATDVEPLFVGKPYPALYRLAMARTGTAPHETLMIGDRLDTDILGAVRLGMPSALLLSGVTTPDRYTRSPVHADIVAENLADLLRRWRAATRSGDPRPRGD